MNKIEDWRPDTVILVVDDDKYLRDSIKELISKWGIQPDEAETGEIAIEKIKNKKYSLILLDINMANKDGLDVLKEMKNFKITTPTVVMTAYPNDERAEKVLKYNICLCLIKPLNPGGLKEIIKHYVKIIGTDEMETEEVPSTIIDEEVIKND